MEVINNIHGILIGFPTEFIDTFYKMVKIVIYVIDRLAQKQCGGEVYLKEYIWYISDTGKHIVKEPRIAKNLNQLLLSLLVVRFL